MILAGLAEYADNIDKGKLDDVSNPYMLEIKKEIKDQYMFGDNILVAPVFKGQYKRKVLLPPGKWYDFYTGRYAGEDETIILDPVPEKIPLFVRDGGIIPMIPPVLHIPAPGEVYPLEIRHYGHSSGSFTLYDDDGVSFNYEKGEYSLSKINVICNKQEKPVGEIIFGNRDHFNYSEISWKYMSADYR